MKRGSKIALIWVSSVCVTFAIVGCERDPLLAPQSGEEKEKGSYGFTSLPGGKIDPENPRKSNPELF